MKCQDYREDFPLFFAGFLDLERRKEIESHLVACENCKMEFESNLKLWQLLDEAKTPEPSENMPAGFNAILNNFNEEIKQKQNPFTDWLYKFQTIGFLQVKPQIAFSIIILLFGFAVGYFLHQPARNEISSNTQIDSLSSQLVEMKQLMMLSMLQNPSASQRILAVGYTDEIPNVDNKVIDALLTTLNEDPNVNVRLMTLEALVKFSNSPRVREGLVQSIGLQDSPLLQSAIADVMVKLQEKKSVQSLEKLLQKKDLNKMVKQKIEQSILKLS